MWLVFEHPFSTMARKLCKMEECLSFDQDESLTVFVKFDKGLLYVDIEQLSSTGTSLYVLFDLPTSSSKYALLYERTKSGYGDVLDQVRPETARGNVIHKVIYYQDGSN